MGGSLFYVAMGALAAAAETLRADRAGYGDQLAAGFAAAKAAAFTG